MISIKPIQYQFIPSDDKQLENAGFCVIDQITKIYGELASSLSKDNVIRQIEEIEEDEGFIDNWTMDKGVRVSTLNNILKEHDVSYYFLSSQIFVLVSLDPQIGIILC